MHGLFVVEVHQIHSNEGISPSDLPLVSYDSYPI